MSTGPNVRSIAVKCLLEARVIAEIPFERERADPRGGYCILRLPERFRIHVAQGDIRSLARERDCDRPPQSTTSAEHERRPSLDSEVHQPISFSRFVWRATSSSMSAMSAGESFGPGLRIAAEAIAPRFASMYLRTASPRADCCS